MKSARTTLLAALVVAAGLLGPGASRAAAQPAEETQERVFEIGAQGAIIYRQLRYKDDIFGFLRRYQLRHSPAAGMYMVAYPFARRVDGPLSRLGFELRYHQMRNLDSVRSDGAIFPSRSNEVIAGLRFRLLGDSLRARGYELSGGTSYADHRFTVDSAIALANTDNRSAVPSVHYRNIRVDVAGRIPLEAGFFISGGLGLRIVLDAGDIDSDDWFPRSRRAGIDSSLHVGYVLPYDLEVQMGFETRRYFYHLNPQPGDPWIAGGALDRYVLVDFRLGWRY